MTLYLCRLILLLRAHLSRAVPLILLFFFLFLNYFVARRKYLTLPVVIRLKAEQDRDMIQLPINCQILAPSVDSFLERKPGYAQSYLRSGRRGKLRT